MGTYGLRWHRGYFWLHLMWHDYEPPQHWRAIRLRQHYKYRQLETALKQLTRAEAVLIFPA
jgi:hypothetical protein